MKLPALLILLALCRPAAAETLYAFIQQDTWLDEMPLTAASQPLSAGAASQLMVGRVGDNDQTPRRRSLIQFNLEDVPENALVQSATVTLYAFKVKTDFENIVTLQRITSEWVAGIYNPGSGGHSGGGNPGDASWLHTSSPAEWNTPGGDFIGTTSASAFVSSTGFYQWTGAELAADVQSWISGDAGNYGWIVRGDEESPFSTVKEFASAQYFQDDYAPVLTLEYIIVPEPGAASLVLAAMAAGCRRRRR